MPPAPLLVTWSKLTSAWSLLRQQRSFRAATAAVVQTGRAAALVAYQLVCLLFRAVISGLVVIAPAILGGILGYFCFFHGSSGTGMFFKALLSTEILATNVAAKTLLAFGVSSLVSVAFIAWRRRADFIALVRAAWLWMWWGRLEETPGLVKAMSRQLAVYSGLFFALFVGVGQNRDDKSRTLPAELPQYVTQLSQILDIKLAPIINVRDSCERALVEGRSGLVVYLDKSSESAQSDQPKSNQPEAEQVKFDLIYVALFENASFGPDVKVGRTLSYSERVRLENFANSLRQIADTLRRAGDQAGRLRIEVRGFASDAPKKEHVREKDKENNEVANDRARSVYRFLCGVLKETAADLPPPIIWELPAQMRYNRQLDDGLVQSPEQRQTALAEMPNRRVEILVTLPPGLKVRRVSESIAREELPRR